MVDKANYRELPRINNDPLDAEKLEAEILRVFKRQVFAPLMRILQQPLKVVTNARHTPLTEAIRLGRVAFSRGVFSGKFDAATSKELRSLGAKWDKRTSTWRLPLAELPEEIQSAIQVSEARFLGKLKAMERELTQILSAFPSEIARSIDATKIFDTSLWKTDRAVAKSLKAIAVLPDLSPERRKRIAEEWHDNLELPIKNFATEEVERLRDLVQKHAFKGGRYDQLVETIRRQYGVTQSKAWFLARQETSLLVTKFKETRYTDAGVLEYRWACVTGSPAHPVRPAHRALQGGIFRWDEPPITTEPGEPVRRNNPGQDFNCRCTAIPVVRKRQ